MELRILTRPRAANIVAPCPFSSLPPCHFVCGASALAIVTTAASTSQQSQPNICGLTVIVGARLSLLSLVSCHVPRRGAEMTFALSPRAQPPAIMLAFSQIG